MNFPPGARAARPHVAVIGGGVAGLTAAFRLVRDAGDGPAPRVTVFEGAPRVGGKLRVSEVAGVPVDEGAESMLARRPEGTGLAADAGLGGVLMHPAPVSAALLSRGALRPFPARQVQGIPADPDALAASGVLSEAGVARVRQDRELPPTPLDDDVPVAAYVGARMGTEVVDRLVEPLLGGVYAGRADRLSLAATLPGVYRAAREHTSLLDAAASLLPPPGSPATSGPAGMPAPVFATIDGGMGRLPETLAAEITAAGGEVRTSAMIRELARTPDGWRLTVGPACEPEYVTADAVIVAVPARPASRLLAGVAPVAARNLARVEYASMGIVTLAYPAESFPAPPSGSGYLVPAVETGRTGERRTVKAVTFVTTKWPHVAARAGDLVIARCSLGRYGDEHVLQRDDADLITLAAAELADVCGVAGPPVATRVTRWGGGLPQYDVGHLDLVAAVRADVAAVPGLAVCGAAYDGVGVPACAAGARTAAGSVREALTAARQ